MESNLEFVYNHMVCGSKDVQKEVQLKIEKINKKYKETADKKRQEKPFEEKDMTMVYLRKERIQLKESLLNNYILIGTRERVLLKREGLI